MKNRWRPFLPVILLFISLTAFFMVATGMMAGWGMDRDVVLTGNFIIFIATLLSYLLATRGLSTTNPHAFVRSVMGSVMIKMVVCLAGAVVYIMLSRDNINKPSLFLCMGLYLLYTFIEVNILVKRAKPKPNA